MYTIRKVRKYVSDMGLLPFAWHALRTLKLVVAAKLNNFLVPYLYPLLCRLPIKKKWIVLESEGDFTDNTRALYEYMRTHCKGYKYIWMVQRPENFKNAGDTIFTSFTDASRKTSAYYYIARSGHILYTHNMISPIKKRKGQMIYRMSHGFGLKGPKGGIMITKKDVDGVIDLGPMSPNFFSGIVYGVPPEDILPLGFARNDLLMNTQGAGCTNPFLPEEKKNCKVLLWMPTFRSSWNPGLSETLCDTSTGLPLLETSEMLADFNEYLREKNVFVILKVHHLQAEKPAFEEKFSNIAILKDEDILGRGLQLYEVVGKTDALLTDYSSVAYDYMLLDKPIGFILDDVENYRKSRAFLVDDVESYMPGDHIYDADGLRSFVDDVATDIDRHREERERLKPKVLGPADNHACERIVEYLRL